MTDSDENINPEDQNVVDEPEEELPPIEIVLDGFLHRVLDIEDCAIDFITLAREKFIENSSRLKSELSKIADSLNIEDDRDKKLHNIKSLSKLLRELDRHNNSSPVSTLEKSLFINLFAVFDKYIGDLVTVLYQEKADLYKNINREISLCEVLKYETIDELREVMLDKEIETLRRKGYIEQFEDLEKKFSIKLTKFASWPNFIECAQRRNLFTHCDGVVSKQYIDICKSVNYKFEDEPVIGDQLRVGHNYLFQSCQLITEVAVMLAHTLWRKTKPDERKQADSHISRLVYNLLFKEHWSKAISLSKFALALPEISTDEMERIFTVNYSIALKAINNHSAAKNVLDKKDWSAATYDFKLAYAVLDENYSEARVLMERVGKKGELVSELSYHDWPLFREFRETDEFFDGYLSVYGYKYSSKLSSLAEEKKSTVQEVDPEDSGI